MAEKGEELLMPMAPFALGEHVAALDVECGEERRRAVPEVIVGHALEVTQAHRQQRGVRSSAWIWLFSSTESTSA